MEENCTHNCETCSADCASRQQPESLLAAPNPASSVKKVFAVISGKGGVGKSLVTSMLSVLMQRRGYAAAILDADVTGPSIPKVFGVKEKADGSELGLIPVRTGTGIDIMSVNLLLENDTDPVVWRGPVISGVVKQFWTDVIWHQRDCMFIDMPPGTGDVPLTIFQSLPLDGVIIVTSPQELVSMIVAKAVKMAQMMNIPILGIVENMSYLECPDCGKRIPIFGESHLEEVAAQYGLPVLGRIPMDQKVAQACDAGKIEDFQGSWLDGAADAVEAFLKE